MPFVQAIARIHLPWAAPSAGDRGHTIRGASQRTTSLAPSTPPSGATAQPAA
jgi:hypothetical protein